MSSNTHGSSRRSIERFSAVLNRNGSDQKVVEFDVELDPDRIARKLSSDSSILPSLNEALAGIKSAIQVVEEELCSLSDKADSISISFGVKFGTSTNLLFFTLGGESNLDIQVTFNLNRNNTTQDDGEEPKNSNNPTDKTETQPSN